MRLLLLHSLYNHSYSYYLDWRDAFLAAEAEVTEVDLATPGRAVEARRLVREHDAVVVLHSLLADDLVYLDPLVPWLRDRGAARLCVFVGNEYNSPRSHLGMADRIGLLERLRPDLVASQLLPETAAWLYAEVPEARVESIPHALNPARFQALTPHAERRFDLGGRSARYTPLLGDSDRYRVYERFNRGDLPVVVDLPLGERLSGEEWPRYLDQCRGTIATEAGSRFVERDDRTVNRIVDWLSLRNPSLALFGLEKRVPPGWLQRRAATVCRGITAQLVARGHRGPDPVYERADAEEIRSRFFPEPDPLTQANGKCISSRHFDALGTRTCQILLRGRYNDLLKPDVHYLALEPDFSNLDEVLARFQDPQERERIADQGLAHALESHTHAHRVKRVLDLLSAC
ncbi:MAG: glycosyltransferase family 1 protein [Planctomycetes bacterium]|nr:glycosyltransferase family 1 protein [Planctomycetota bacterium]